MGILSGGRCCGRNIIFDAVTGINPPIQACSYLYSFDLESAFGALQPNYFIKTPDAVSHTISFPSDVITVQDSGYYLMSATSGVNNPAIGTIYLYGTPDQITGWEILNPNTLLYESINWGAGTRACATTKCYAYEFDIDELTYPSASVYAINNEFPDPFNTPLQVAVNLFSNPSFDTELAELIRSMFGGSVSVTSSYDGTTYIIRINNVQSVQTEPNFPEFLNLLIDLDPGTGNYIYSEGIERPCL